MKYVWLDIISTNKDVIRDCIKGKFLLYKFIKDCAYLVCPHIYKPFKGCPKGLEGY